MVKRVYCTYFDHRYASRGIAMIESLRRAGERGDVFVLALTKQVEHLLQGLDDGVRVVTLSELERDFEGLVTVKQSRSLIDYYFTLTPCLVRYVAALEPDRSWVTYLDADLWFYTSPSPIYDELDGSSVGIVPHRYPPGSEWRLKFGIYNVGWVSFRCDSAGLKCLTWWADRCLEWCADRPEVGKYADQGYLDDFMSISAGVGSVHHPGVNLAPWNLRTHNLHLKGDSVEVDGEPLIFFHFHGIHSDARRYYFKHLGYGVKTTPLIKNALYRPYLTAIASYDARFEQLLGSPTCLARRRACGPVSQDKARTEVTRWVDIYAGNYINRTELAGRG